MNTLKVKISSDSGVGPYTEIKHIANCYMKKGVWYCSDGTKVRDRFFDGMADFKCKILSVKNQKYFVYV